ncbi:MAG: DUF697 domain-containing protein [Prochloron sp. SP5CPC1]|nr:DUF697 domain-containing protein [Candidatus Paraprochloron terpiosi SP5CPC1]
MSNLSPEFDLSGAILSFAEIQEELNYKKAQYSLRKLVGDIDLTSVEQVGLSEQIHRLVTMLDKLERYVVQIAVFGMVGRGKSSVLNALLGEDIFTVGPLHGVTRTSANAKWKVSRDSSVLRLSLPGGKNGGVELIDTPGIDEVAGESREALAREIAQKADLILFVIAGDLTKVEYRAICQLRQFGKPMVLVFNKIDQYPEADRLAIYRKIRDQRVRQLLKPSEIVMVAASPLVREAVRLPGGSYKVAMRRGTPQVEELKLKILEILHREGKSLVALNTMLFASTVNERLVERKMTIRALAADRLIYKAVIGKAGAIALNPVTAIDLFTGAVMDIAMILALSRLYGIPMTKSGAVGLLRKIAWSMGGITGSELLVSLGLSSLKGIFGLSVPVTGGASFTGYVTVAMAQAGVAGVSSYSIGQITKIYLANGANWGEDGPKIVVRRILASLDQSSILNRIEVELKAKLNAGFTQRHRDTER